MINQEGPTITEDEEDCKSYVIEAQNVTKVLITCSMITNKFQKKLLCANMAWVYVLGRFPFLDRMRVGKGGLGSVLTYLKMIKFRSWTCILFRLGMKFNVTLITPKRGWLSDGNQLNFYSKISDNNSKNRRWYAFQSHFRSRTLLRLLIKWRGVACLNIICVILFAGEWESLSHERF